LDVALYICADVDFIIEPTAFIFTAVYRSHYTSTLKMDLRNAYWLSADYTTVFNGR
jgi:hypothetical protein